MGLYGQWECGQLGNYSFRSNQNAILFSSILIKLLRHFNYFLILDNNVIYKSAVF